MKKYKKYIGILLALSIFCSLAACGYSDNTYSLNEAEYTSGLNSASGIYFDSSATADMAYDRYYEDAVEVNSAASKAPTPAPTYNSNDNNKSQTSSYLETQKLIYRCDISLESTEFAEAQRIIKDLVNQYDGFIAYDSVSDNARDWYYSSYNKTSGTLHETMTVRIPIKNYESFVNGVAGIGKVIAKSENVENITKQYSDTETTIKSLKTQEERLLQMMADCNTVSDMIVVESRLSEVQSQLERYKTKLDGYDMDIQFSTVTINLREVMEFSKEIKEISFVERFIDAISDSAEEFVEFLQDLSIAIVYLLPYALLVAILVFVIIKITKICIRKSESKKAAKLKADTTNEATTEKSAKENDTIKK